MQTRATTTSGKTDKLFMLPIAQATRGLATIDVNIAPRDVVYLKGLLEASEGLACLFAESGGKLTLASAPECISALRELVDDFLAEVGEAMSESVADAEGMDDVAQERAGQGSVVAEAGV